MIRLKRPPVPAGHAARATKGTIDLWKEWKSKGETPKSKSSIYAHAEVKTAFRITAQNNKCAYCETLNPRSHDVIEHFRPKSGWQQKRGDKLRFPAYFWLAYEWSNLLFACDVCNDAAHKGNLFPLAKPASRATDSSPDVSTEVPLLINPFDCDPEAHIEWNRDIPRPRNRSRMGRTSIEVFGLASDGLLMDQRRGYLIMLTDIVSGIEKLPTDDSTRENLRLKMLDCLADSAPWAAMVRANLETRILAL